MRDVQNLTNRDRCRCEDGLVLVGTNKHGMEEYAPCPDCELGFAAEFPTSKSAQRHLAWGPDGYWRGGTAAVEFEPPDKPPLPVAENALRLRLLKARMGGRADVDPCVFLDVRDAVKRLESLRGYVERLA